MRARESGLFHISLARGQFSFSLYFSRVRAPWEKRSLRGQLVNGNLRQTGATSSLRVLIVQGSARQGRAYPPSMRINFSLIRTTEASQSFTKHPVIYEIAYINNFEYSRRRAHSETVSLTRQSDEGITSMELLLSAPLFCANVLGSACEQSRDSPVAVLFSRVDCHSLFLHKR